MVNNHLEHKHKGEITLLNASPSLPPPLGTRNPPPVGPEEHREGNAAHVKKFGKLRRTAGACEGRLNGGSTAQHAREQDRGAAATHGKGKGGSKPKEFPSLDQQRFLVARRKLQHQAGRR